MWKKLQLMNWLEKRFPAACGRKEPLVLSLIHISQRNIITRALGTREKERLDLFHEHWNREDILLLCTDGLTGGLPPETIRKILAEHQSLAEKAEKLIQQALEADGSDNVTVVLALNDEGVDA